MNWYKLDIVRTVRGHGGGLEVWQRVIGGETHRTFLNYENQELLVPEDALLATAEALQLPAREFLAAVKRRGGAYLGLSPE